MFGARTEWAATKEGAIGAVCRRVRRRSRFEILGMASLHGLRAICLHSWCLLVAIGSRICRAGREVELHRPSARPYGNRTRGRTHRLGGVIDETERGALCRIPFRRGFLRSSSSLAGFALLAFSCNALSFPCLLPVLVPSVGLRYATQRSGAKAPLAELVSGVFRHPEACFVGLGTLCLAPSRSFAAAGKAFVGLRWPGCIILDEEEGWSTRSFEGFGLPYRDGGRK